MEGGQRGWRGTARRGERAATLAAVGAIHVLLGLALLSGLSPRLVRQVEQPMTLVDVAPPPPPPPPEAPAPKAKERVRDAPAPPAPKAEPKPIAAPPVRIPQPVKLAAAPIAGQGSANQSGAATAGTGTGAGGNGNGMGAGGGGGIASHAQWLAGAISDRDYPDEAKRAGVEGAVAILFTVRRDGRIADCRIDRSSGSVELDRLTCALAVQRLRFDPARDAAGRPVEEVSGRFFRFVLGRRR